MSVASSVAFLAARRVCTTPTFGQSRVERAVLAVRLAGVADLPAVEDHPVAEQRPLLCGSSSIRSCSTFTGSVCVVSPSRRLKPADVRIDRDAGHAERVAEDDVGRLAADAGQVHQFLERSRHLAAVLARRAPGSTPECSSPCSGRSRWSGSSSSRSASSASANAFGGREAGEQGRRDQVHPLVGALGREDRGDEQLQRRPEIEAALRVRVGVGQGVEECGDGRGGRGLRGMTSS